jgi:hypothetical protein
MIAPFLGDQEKGLQANVLQSMLQESGVGISPMLQQVLDGMRNPAADPQQALAIQTYKEATDKQAQANLELARMNTNLANDISTKTGNAVAEAIKKNTIKFEEKQLDDLVNKINGNDNNGNYIVITFENLNSIRLYIFRQGLSNDTTTYINANSLTLNTWYHITVTMTYSASNTSVVTYFSSLAVA